MVQASDFHKKVQELASEYKVEQYLVVSKEPDMDNILLSGYMDKEKQAESIISLLNDDLLKEVVWRFLLQRRVFLEDSEVEDFLNENNLSS